MSRGALEFVRDSRLTSFNGIEQVSALCGLLDICVDEERVSLRVYVLHHNLEAIEAAGFWDLNLGAEALDQVLVDDTV